VFHFESSSLPANSLQVRKKCADKQTNEGKKLDTKIKKPGTEYNERNKR
jgi:hypothetical protein